MISYFFLDSGYDSPDGAHSLSPTSSNIYMNQHITLISRAGESQLKRCLFSWKNARVVESNSVKRNKKSTLNKFLTGYLLWQYPQYDLFKTHSWLTTLFIMTISTIWSVQDTFFSTQVLKLSKNVEILSRNFSDTLDS